MDKELKEKWVEALRSGKYRQARNTIYYRRAYCCLGVLSVCIDTKMRGTRTDYPEDRVLTFRTQRELSDLNDGLGCRPQNFREIADYIEKNL